MGNQVFGFSEDTLKERKRNTFTVMAMMPLLMIIFVLIFTGGSSIQYKNVIIIIAITVPIIMIEMIIVYKMMIKKIKEMKLIIQDDCFKRVGGKFSENISYKSIDEILVKRDKNGKILVMEVKSNNIKVNLLGFEDMEKILSLLSGNIKNKSFITEKTYKISYKDPMIVILIMILTMTLIIALVKTDVNSYRIFSDIFPFAFGLFVIFFKPISKNAGSRFRILEIIISILLVVAGLLVVFGNIL